MRSLSKEAKRKHVGVADVIFQFHKRGQLFIRPHNKTISIVAVRVNNPDRSRVGINR